MAFEDDSIVVDQNSSFELTPRELAILAGDNPDDVEESTEEVAEQEDDVQDAEEIQDDVQEETVAQEDTEVEGKDATWVTEDITDLAQAYGIENDLDDFASEEEFRRAAKLLEKKFGEPAPKEEPKEEEAKSEEEEKPDYSAVILDPEYYVQEGYDEDTVNIVRKLKQQDEELQQYRQYIAEVQHRQGMDEFHAVVDSMGERYGDGDEVSDEQDKARESLWKSATTVAQSYLDRGEELPPLKSLLKRAEMVAFGEEIEGERQQQLQEKVKKQSGTRRKVGRNTTKPQGKREVPGESDDPVKAIANNPELVKFWKEHAS